MVRDQRRRDFVKTIGAAGLIGLAGCGSDGDGTDTEDGGNDNENGNGEGTPAGRTIDLGILMGVTGGLEELGPPIRDTAQLVPRQINDADTDQWRSLFYRYDIRCVIDERDDAVVEDTDMAEIGRASCRERV